MQPKATYSKQIITDATFEYEVWMMTSAPTYPNSAGQRVTAPRVEFFIVNPETYPCGRQKPTIVDLAKPIAALHVLKSKYGTDAWSGFDANAISLIKQPLRANWFDPETYSDSPLLLPILGFSNHTCIGNWRINWPSTPTGREVPLETQKDRYAASLSQTFSNLSDSGLMGENKAYHKGMIALAAALYTEKGLEKYSVVEETPDRPRPVLTAWRPPSLVQGAVLQLH